MERVVKVSSSTNTSYLICLIHCTKNELKINFSGNQLAIAFKYIFFCGNLYSLYMFLTLATLDLIALN